MTPATLPTRPERIGRCHHGHHPVLLFREVGGVSGLTLRIDEAEAQLLADEQDGRRSRHSRTYESLEQIVTGLGAAVVGLELVGDRERGLSGVVQLARQRRRLRIRVHPCDVAALARRLHLPVHIPVGVVAALREEDLDWWPEVPCQAVADLDAIAAFRPVLQEADPEGFDW